MADATESTRVPDYEIAEAFHARWSPRAFTGEEIPERILHGLFEAARWAPSAMNAQPWRFVYARRGSPAFERLLASLVPANQVWASKASALVAILSARTMRLPRGEVVPSASHSFDAGAAWAQMALQAQLWGWSTHAMGGFDREVVRQVLAVPEDHAIEVVVAVGKRGDPSTLPEWARSREKPSDRLPLSVVAREGRLSP